MESIEMREEREYLSTRERYEKEKEREEDGWIKEKKRAR